jgi:3-isopropylmalate/(R)-2-methylmalate dehydratase small subunit
MIGITEHKGVCAPLIIENVDTDQIIPSREMTRVSKTGLGSGLFAGWRYLYDGKNKTGLNMDFVLNQPQFEGASILLGGINFGCGSSREHAVWALEDFGIKVIIAESFGRIFRNNCAHNGLLAIDLPASAIENIRAQTSASPQQQQLLVDLVHCKVRTPAGDIYTFEIDGYDRSMLLKGLDYIDHTLQFAEDIDRFVTRDRESRPWAYL